VGERFDVERDGRTYVRQRFFARIALADDDAFQADRVGYVSVGMLFDYDLQTLVYTRIL
jgi:hypothetical protein